MPVFIVIVRSVTKARHWQKLTGYGAELSCFQEADATAYAEKLLHFTSHHLSHNRLTADETLQP